LGRIEMHLESLKDQTVSVGSHTFSFIKGETIHTENSYKYNVAEFQALAREAGMEPTAAWWDDDWLFSIHFLRVN
ncbi:MAG: L-histidine N(alpha)-methyltransferase, partial [Alphaproteobacteria bacterium]